MKKKVLAVLMAFAMLTASFGGSLKYEAAARLTNLVTASAEEQKKSAIKTKFDKTLLYADDAAFDAEFSRVKNELLPAYNRSVQSFNNIDNVIDWLKQYNECGSAVEKLALYGDVGVRLDGSNKTAIEQYYSASNLYDDFYQITSSAIEQLQSKDKTFINSLIADERLKLWQNFISDIAGGNSFSEYERFLLAPAEKAMSSYEDIYNTLIDTDLVYENLTAPDGKIIEANITNCFSIDEIYDDQEFNLKVKEAYFQALKNYENTFAGLLNGYITSSESLAKRYGYSSVLEMSSAADGITPDTVLNLVKSGGENTDIFKRYMNMEYRAYGYDSENPDADTEPVFEQPDMDYSYENARNILVKALAPLGDEYISVLNKAFDDGWIDVYPDDNKVSGGLTISYSGVTVPCVIVNYTDDYNSLSSLAHELGHAIHDYMSIKNQSCLYNDMAPIFSAEVSSLTNELLLARYMQNSAKTDDERLYYLMQEFNIYNMNFFGCLVDTEFECGIRDIVNNGGTLTASTLDKLFDSTLRKYYPDSINIKNRDVSWAYVLQFYSPYYNKSYSFAIIAASNLVNNIMSGDEEATENYLAFLKAGGSRNGSELYALVGTNLTDPSYIQPFYDRCNKIIDESEAIVNQKTLKK